MLQNEPIHGFRRFNWIHSYRDLAWGTALVFLSVLWLTLVGSIWAEAAEPGQFESVTPIAKSDSSDSDGDYSFNWLDPEKKIYVLQNRKYLKAYHPIVSVLAGVGFSNPYRSTANVDGRFAFHFSEALGIELFYIYTSNAANDAAQALSTTNISPNVREIQAQYGAKLQWVPWYAKINVFDSILHFDWYFGAGAGALNTVLYSQTISGQTPTATPQSMLGISLSTGHLYHLSQHFLVRVDLTGVFYQAASFSTSGGNTWYSNYNFGIGLGWKI